MDFEKFEEVFQTLEAQKEKDETAAVQKAFFIYLHRRCDKLCLFQGTRRNVYKFCK